MTPLSYAAVVGSLEADNLLLSIGDADINSKDNCGLTPLSWAVKKGHEVVVRLLLEKGADLESIDCSHRNI